MKFKKLISSALLFLAAIIGIAPAHADYAVQIPIATVNKLFTVSTNTYAAQFIIPLSPFALQGPFVLPKQVTPVAPFSIKLFQPFVPPTITFIVNNK